MRTVTTDQRCGCGVIHHRLTPAEHTTFEAMVDHLVKHGGYTRDPVLHRCKVLPGRPISILDCCYICGRWMALVPTI
jgi:hypothetical protein